MGALSLRTRIIPPPPGGPPPPPCQYGGLTAAFTQKKFKNRSSYPRDPPRDARRWSLWDCGKRRKTQGLPPDRICIISPFRYCQDDDLCPIHLHSLLRRIGA